MEALELKQIMDAYNTKLDQTLHINKSSMLEMQLEKPKKVTDKVHKYRIFETVSFSLLAIFTAWYTANHWGQTHLVISGIVLHLFTLIALVGSIGQLVLLQQIDFSKPIVEIRKKIELVNSHQLLFIKLLFLSGPVWWAYAIVSIDVFLGVDLFLYLDSDFVLRYLILNFLLIIPLGWAFYKLSYKNLHIKWVRKTIKFFVGTKTMKALEFLNEIEEFKSKD